MLPSHDNDVAVANNALSHMASRFRVIAGFAAIDLAQGGLRCRQAALLFILFVLCNGAYAQIYACRGPDGTRIFSDQRCGPDAKLIAGAAGKKRSGASKEAPSKPDAAPKTAVELEALLARCDGGDTAACNAWTRNGGPNQLRDKERQSQLACEGGSLAACEERYCADGASDQCQKRVLKTTKLAGDNWYLRTEKLSAADRTTRYDLRCIWKNVRETRDIGVTCTATAGPHRCSSGEDGRTFDRLEAAADSRCANR